MKNKKKKPMRKQHPTYFNVYIVDLLIYEEIAI